MKYTITLFNREYEKLDEFERLHENYLTDKIEDYIAINYGEAVRMHYSSSIDLYAIERIYFRHNNSWVLVGKCDYRDLVELQNGKKQE